MPPMHNEPSLSCKNHLPSSVSLSRAIDFYTFCVGLKYGWEIFCISSSYNLAMLPRRKCRGPCLVVDALTMMRVMVSPHSLRKGL